jgi:hypothetical protein
MAEGQATKIDLLRALLPELPQSTSTIKSKQKTSNKAAPKMNTKFPDWTTTKSGKGLVKGRTHRSVFASIKEMGKSTLLRYMISSNFRIQ